MDKYSLGKPYNFKSPLDILFKYEVSSIYLNTRIQPESEKKLHFFLFNFNLLSKSRFYIFTLA